MARHLIVLLLLTLAVLIYEAGGLFGFYPTISATVGSFPLVAVVLIAIGTAVLAVHWIRMWQRAQQDRRQ